MMKSLTKNELVEHLKEQLDFLEASSTSFDNGFTSEAKRLAVTVRVLVHDTRNSTSLLSHLDKKKISFFDSAIPHIEENLGTHSGLVLMTLGKNGSRALPILDDGFQSSWIKFHLWWNGVVFVDNNRNEFSRRDIVLNLANKEGGAHVDSKLDEAYNDLRRNNSLGWYEGNSEGKEVPTEDQVPASMRQIAHEVLKTLKEDYSCNNTFKEDDGIITMGASIVEGSKPPNVNIPNIPKTRPLIRGKKISRNDPCFCGSGKKYKFCCLK